MERNSPREGVELLPIMAYKGRLCHKGGTFFRVQLYKKGMDFTWSKWKGRKICKRTPKDWQMHFMPLKKLTKLSGFDLFIFWTQCIYIVHQLKGMQSSKLGIWKVYRLLIEGIWKAYLWKQPFLLAPRHWDVLRGGTSVTQRQKFHTDNV